MSLNTLIRKAPVWEIFLVTLCFFTGYGFSMYTHRALNEANVLDSSQTSSEPVISFADEEPVVPEPLILQEEIFPESVVAVVSDDELSNQTLSSSSDPLTPVKKPVVKHKSHKKSNTGSKIKLNASIPPSTSKKKPIKPKKNNSQKTSNGTLLVGSPSSSTSKPKKLVDPEDALQAAYNTSPELSLHPTLDSMNDSITPEELLSSLYDDNDPVFAHYTPPVPSQPASSLPSLPSDTTELPLPDSNYGYDQQLFVFEEMPQASSSQYTEDSSSNTDGRWIYDGGYDSSDWVVANLESQSRPKAPISDFIGNSTSLRASREALAAQPNIINPPSPSSDSSTTTLDAWDESRMQGENLYVYNFDMSQSAPGESSAQYEAWEQAADAQPLEPLPIKEKSVPSLPFYVEQYPSSTPPEFTPLPMPMPTLEPVPQTYAVIRPPLPIPARPMMRRPLPPRPIAAVGPRPPYRPIYRHPRPPYPAPYRLPPPRRHYSAAVPPAQIPIASLPAPGYALPSQPPSNPGCFL